MRTNRSCLTKNQIPAGEAVFALAGILNHMNGDSDGLMALRHDEPDSEPLGYQIEASAILDQLIAKGFIITRIE